MARYGWRRDAVSHISIAAVGLSHPAGINPFSYRLGSELPIDGTAVNRSKSGLDLKRRLDEKACQTPLIMVSGRLEHLDADVRETGAICLLRKPFEGGSVDFMRCPRHGIM
jgi:hypothetical protein